MHYRFFTHLVYILIVCTPMADSSAMTASSHIEYEQCVAKQHDQNKARIAMLLLLAHRNQRAYARAISKIFKYYPMLIHEYCTIVIENPDYLVKSAGHRALFNKHMQADSFNERDLQEMLVQSQMTLQESEDFRTQTISTLEKSSTTLKKLLARSSDKNLKYSIRLINNQNKIQKLLLMNEQSADIRRQFDTIIEGK